MQSLQSNPQPGTGNDSKRDEQPSSKVTKFDLINKNFIMPQQPHSYQSNYTGSYPGHSNQRVKTDKVIYPDNQVIPKGKFQGGSSYLYDYLNTQGLRGQAIKPEGQLKVGGIFTGQSSYGDDYKNKGSAGRQDKVTFPNNHIMPQGKFEDVSTYTGNYLNNPAQRSQKFKPQGQIKIGNNPFQGQSSYLADYYSKENVTKAQKIKFKENQIMPKGAFEGSSNYRGAYTGAPETDRSKASKPEGQLKIGGQFYGASTYANDHNDKGAPQRTEKYIQQNNKMFPEGKFEDVSTYTGNYLNNPAQRTEKFKPEGELKVGGGTFDGSSSYVRQFEGKMSPKQDKITYRDNQVIPHGGFEGSSTYAGNYIEKQMSRNPQFRPQQQLKVGGKFEGQSKYLTDFSDKGMGGRQERAPLPVNQILPKGHFEGSSTYAGNYIQSKVARIPQIRPQGQLRVGEGKFEGSSSYGADYLKKEGGMRAEPAKVPINQIMPKGDFDHYSTYGNSYLENHVQRSKQIRPEGELKVGGGTFDGSSSYVRQFEGKTAARQEKITYKNNEVIPHGGFEGSSTYAGNYIEKGATRNLQIRPQGQLRVGEGRFEGASSYGADYMKRQGQAIQTRVPLPHNEVMPKGQFSGQSTYGGAYLSSGTNEKRIQYRPQNNLSVGGEAKFQGYSSYTIDHDPQTQGRRYFDKQSHLVYKQ